MFSIFVRINNNSQVPTAVEDLWAGAKPASKPPPQTQKWIRIVMLKRFVFICTGSLLIAFHRPVRKSQVEKLEEKLDGLVTLLRSSQDSKASNESSVPAIFDTSPATPRPYSDVNSLSQPLHDGVSGPPWIRLETANGSGGSQPSQHSEDRATASIAATSDYDLRPKIPDCVGFTSEQANAMLNRFRNEMSPFFPFVIVSPSFSAEDLQRDRPLLLESVLAVASPVSEYQVTLGKWLVRQLTERMAINGERNLDLLLGVLTYTAWFVT